MNYEPNFPFVAEPLIILAVFIAALLLFHIIFLWIVRLTPRGLKSIDYWWLGAAILGLLGSSYQVRRLFAENLIDGQRLLRDSHYEMFYSAIDRLSQPKVLVRTEFLPPDFDETQRAYDSASAFARGMLSSMSKPNDSVIREVVWRQRPHISNKVLLQTFEEIDRSYNDYLATKRGVETLEAIIRRDDIDVTIMAVTPLLLAVALALRITKVTGELRLDSSRQ